MNIKTAYGYKSVFSGLVHSKIQQPFNKRQLKLVFSPGLRVKNRFRRKV